VRYNENIQGMINKIDFSSINFYTKAIQAIFTFYNKCTTNKGEGDEGKEPQP